MKKIKICYLANLSGINKSEDHIKKLESHPSFHIIVKKKKRNIILDITEPDRKISNFTSQEIQKDLSDRASKLKINRPDLVESAKQAIFDAQKAEQITYSGEMHMETKENVKGESTFVTLEVMCENNPQIKACVDQYALQRITRLAKVIGMKIEKFSIIPFDNGRYH